MAATSDNMMNDMGSDTVPSGITCRDCVGIYVW